VAVGQEVSVAQLQKLTGLCLNTSRRTLQTLIEEGVFQRRRVPKEERGLVDGYYLFRRMA
jgi:Fic family protein